MTAAAATLGSLTRPAGRTASAFTLVEVILAVAIATGILLVALVLYRQAAELRARILQESERLAAMRMVLDRLAGEFRSAQTDREAGGEFLGTLSSVRFVRLTLNAPTASLTVTTNSMDRTDRLRVFFSAEIETNGTQVVVHALSRAEEPMPISSFGSGTNLSETFSRSTNRVSETLIDTVRFVRFRYWSGSEWADFWSNAVPPSGMEIILATDSAGDEVPGGTLPEDPFRRVVHIPAGAVAAASSSNNLETVPFR